MYDYIAPLIFYIPQLLLGKRFEIDNHEHLTQGVYLKVTEYKNGDKQVVKVLQSDH